MTSPMAGIQHLGRSLMLPIAVLPVAALLLRVGQPDLLDIAFVAAAGDAIFSNLGLLFAIGVAVGFAREHHGAAGLAGVVGFLVATEGAAALITPPPYVLAGLSDAARAAAEQAYTAQALSKMSVPVGILSGIVAGLLYNRYATIRLPEYLAFFGGRRFVPIASGCTGLVLAAAFGLGWGAVEAAIDTASRAIVEAGGVGLFIYGALNRVLIVTGLHHILNNAAWFIIGDFGGVTGDLRRFFAGDPDAGAFMSGFFPVMMFGLPAACLAMYHAVPADRRKAVGGMFLSMALTSFLTGVTEPIEFTFMFLAPVLYAIHALLTGVSMTVMDALGVKLGFGFSAGLFDYVLNFNKSTRPLILLPIGAAYFAAYYAMFRIVIRAFDLKTPGRDGAGVLAGPKAPAPSTERASDFIRALGGADNLTNVGACTTRLRLVVQDQDSVDEAALKALGAKGMIRPSATTLQVVLGPTAELVATQINRQLGGSADTDADDPSAPAPQATEVARKAPFGLSDVDALIEAMGGVANIRSAAASSNRLCLDVKKIPKLDVPRLKALGVRDVVPVGDDTAHLLTPGDVSALARTLLHRSASDPV